MEDSGTRLTCGMIIKEARKEKSYSINDLAYELSKTKEIEDVKKFEKKITLWEKEKAYPNLDEVYLLAYTLETIDPTQLMILRDRHRKNMNKTNTKRKYRKFNWDEFKENLYYVVVAFGRLFIIFAIIIFAIYYAKLVDSSLNGNGGMKGFDEEVRKLYTEYNGIL